MKIALIMAMLVLTGCGIKGVPEFVSAEQGE
jgi:hypothetical protein